MAGPLTIEICSPAFKPVSHDAESVVIPGAAGIFTVLPGHTSVLTTLTSGVVIVEDNDGNKTFYAVHGGFAEVLNNAVRILADEIEPADTIDRHAAEAELHRAAEGMRKPGIYKDAATAEHALIKARAQLQAANHQDY